MKGAGTTSIAQQYEYMDAQAAQKGVTYYRLKQLDADGTVQYSKTVSVEGLNKGTVSVFLTLAKDVLTLEGAETYAVFTTSGQLVLQSVEPQLNVGALPTGIYLLRGLDSQGVPFATKFLKH